MRCWQEAVGLQSFRACPWCHCTVRCRLAFIPLQLIHATSATTPHPQVILKLSKEKWEEAAAHAMTAVVPDFRRRVWYPPGHAMGVGLVFNAKYGAPQLRDSISLAQTSPDGSVKVRIIEGA